MARERIVQVLGVLITVATIVVTVAAVITEVTGHTPGS
jgi:hypothetical protein